MGINKWIIIGVSVGLFLLISIIFIASWISFSNKEISLRNQIEAKKRDNKNVYDSTWKQISQSAQVTDAQKKALLEIVTGHAKAREGSGGGSLATMVTESVPNVDTTVFNQLMNIVSSARTRFERVQTEILDLNRAHTNCLTMFPSSIVCGGRPAITVDIITSDRTENAYETGKDNDVGVFK